MPVTVTPNAETALNLARLGYSVFPCQSGGANAKSPMPFIKWREVSTTDERQIRSWWSKWPDAAIGLDLAKSGLIVIDADRHGKADGVASIAEIMADHSHDATHVPVVATPGNGQHFVYRQPAGKQYGNADSREYKGRKLKDIGINIRGHGGYIIAPGTVMSDGKTYSLSGDIGAAPVLPDWFAAILDAPEPPVSKPVPVARAKHSDARIRAYCDSAIKAETERVSSAPSGTRNNTLNEASFAVGQLVGATWISEDEAFALLINAAFQCGLGEVEARKTIQSGLRAGAKEPRTMPPSDYDDIEVDPAEAARISAMILDAWQKKERERLGQRLVIEQDGDLIDEETGEILPVPVPPTGDRQDIDDRYLRPPGLVGELTDWICASSADPIRIHALGAALLSIGTIIGRKIYSASEPTSTALYVAAIAPTGMGKGAPMNCARMVISSVRGGTMMHMGWPKTDAGISSELKKWPVKAVIADEFAEKIAVLRGRNTASHQSAVSEELRTLWGLNMGYYTPSVTALRGSETIAWPVMPVYGATTIKAFVKALKSADVTNGLFNRFLLLPRYGEVQSHEMGDGMVVLPEAIKTRLSSLSNCLNPLQTSLSESSDTPPAAPLLIPFTAEAAEMNRQNKARQKDMVRLSDDDDALALYARYAEQIKRIALIVAAGCHPVGTANAQITGPIMQWAKTIVEYSIGQFVTIVRQEMSENETEANLKHVLAVIRKAGRIKRQDVLRQCRFIKAYDMDGIIKMLRESDCITELQSKASGAGRPSAIYVYKSG